MIIIILDIFLAVGYSAFQNGLEINDTKVVVRAQKDVRITGVRAASATNGAVSNWEEYSTVTISSGMSLPNSNSTITYDIVVTNLGNVDVGLTEISGLPNNLTYSLSGYTIGNTLCDDTDPTKCSLGSVSTLHLTIGYAQGAYDPNNTVFPAQIYFTIVPLNYVARINNTYYPTVIKAVEAVPTDGTLTTIHLLKSTSESEAISISSGKNIEFDLQNYTLSPAKSTPVMEVNGTVKITNGYISTTASQGAINVNYGGTLNISGGSIRAIGGRQAIYNNGGTVNISGNAYLYNSTNQRGTVQNHDARGTINITGGTIVADAFSAVVNEAGTLNIGTKDGTVDSTTPVLQGFKYAVNNSITSGGVTTPKYFNFYDGILKGKTDAIYNDDYVQDKETGYGILYGSETINDTIYKTAILEDVITVGFDPGEDGTTPESERVIKRNTSLGTLPIPTKTNYVFDGWFTQASGGTKLSPTDIISNDITYYAHWTSISEVYIAQIGSNKYQTLAAAITAVPQSTQTTIELLRDTIENVSIPRTKNVILDLNGYTITSSDNTAVLTVAGTAKMLNGTITTNSQNTAAVNVTGTFEMTGGTIRATGLRQAIFNNGGSVTISGNAYLSASTSVRATVQNDLNNESLTGRPGTITILGGTIVSQNFSAVNNVQGTLIIGNKDGNIDTTTPIVRGSQKGVINSATFNFYDGKIMGLTGSYTGTVNDNDGTGIITTSEVFDGDTYTVSYVY